VKSSQKPGPKSHVEYQAVKTLLPEVGQPVQYRAGAVWQNVDVPELGDFEQLLYVESHKSRHPVIVN